MSKKSIGHLFATLAILSVFSGLVFVFRAGYQAGSSMPNESPPIYWPALVLITASIAFFLVALRFLRKSRIAEDTQEERRT